MEDISDSESENSSEEGNEWGIIYQNEKNLLEGKILNPLVIIQKHIHYVYKVNLY